MLGGTGEDLLQALRLRADHVEQEPAALPLELAHHLLDVLQAAALAVTHGHGQMVEPRTDPMRVAAAVVRRRDSPGFPLPLCDPDPPP